MAAAREVRNGRRPRVPPVPGDGSRVMGRPGRRYGTPVPSARGAAPTAATAYGVQQGPSSCQAPHSPVLPGASFCDHHLAFQRWPW